MIKRMPYHKYKVDYYDCKTVQGSYEERTKTIEVIVPDGMRNFREKCWKRGGNAYRLVGTNIQIYVWNSGEKANFLLEEGGRTYTIPGKGARARDFAIRKAYELAEHHIENN